MTTVTPMTEIKLPGTQTRLLVKPETPVLVSENLLKNGIQDSFTPEHAIKTYANGVKTTLEEALKPLGVDAPIAEKFVNGFHQATEGLLTLLTQPGNDLKALQVKTGEGFKQLLNGIQDWVGSVKKAGDPEQLKALPELVGDLTQKAIGNDAFAPLFKALQGMAKG